jgi:hypothetical protein
MPRTKSIIAASRAASLALTAATPAAAWCNYYGCDYGYDNSGALIAGGIMGLAVGAMIAGAAAQQAQPVQAPVCTARNGNPHVARAWRGRWVC